ncbi:MAG: heme-binding protein [Steroidobacteraceae bacterium]
MKTRATIILCELVGLAALGAAAAQTPAPAAGAGAPQAATSTDATRLPGDNPPRSGGMGPPPGGAPGGGPGGAGGPQQGANGKPPQEPGSDAPSPTLEVALEAAQAALAACKSDGYNVGVAVIDSSGQPRVALAADKATGGHVYTAVRKGLAAVAFKVPTSEVARQLAADKNQASLVKPNMATMAGAVPLMTASGELLGAIGASGASSQQDEKCAAAGAAKVKAKLK